MEGDLERYARVARHEPLDLTYEHKGIATEFDTIFEDNDGYMIHRLRECLQKVNEEGDRYSYARHRAFNSPVYTRVTYLNEWMEMILPDLYNRLWEVAEEALAVAQKKEAKAGAEHTEDWQRPLKGLGIRSIEIREYTKDKGVFDADEFDEEDSVYSMYIRLSKQNKDFKGGEFKIRASHSKKADELVFNVLPGNGFLFPSRFPHAVQRMKKGAQAIMVVEFWEEGNVPMTNERPQPKHKKYVEWDGGHVDAERIEREGDQRRRSVSKKGSKVHDTKAFFKELNKDMKDSIFM